jgi:gamma-polyglutamate biosynthesis protein CapA
VSKEENTVLNKSFVGDIMMGRHVEKVTNYHGQNYLFKYVEPYFKNSDYVTGNFEHPVTNRNDYPKADKYIHLQTTADSVITLKDMNFSVLNIANNHTMDFGEMGLKDTLDTFEDVHLDFVGAGVNLNDAMQRISYHEINGLTIATLGFTDAYGKGFKASENRGGILPLEPSIFIPMIADAKKNSDIVIVHAHWGQEYDNEASPRQREFARSMVEAGADIIIGHHPHVLSNIEIYNDSVIFYSLGNFIFDQGWTRTKSSAIVQYKLFENGTGRFEITPLKIREAQPRPLSNLNILGKMTIMRQLTKDSKDLQWSEEDGKLVFEVDHTEILKER